MAHNIDNPPKEFRKNVDDQYRCECGSKFRTYRDWEKHRTAERRKEKLAASA